MAKLTLKAKEFKKMNDPNDVSSKHIKYVCYVQALSIPQEMDSWMSTNPREQKMTTNVALKIKESLADNDNFHELNRGILISAQAATWDNKSEELIITFDDPTIHGNIDGGHTLRAILEAKNKNSLPSNRYVFMEIIVGLNNPVELAAARNTSVQVDLKSIAELEKSFDVIKDVYSNLSFSKRIQYKMNEHYNDNITEIDIREIIAILIMFSQEIYPYKTGNGALADTQPTQCYSGKEASLKKFLKCNASDDNPDVQKRNREAMIYHMKNIIPDIYDLYEIIETQFAAVATQAGKRYGTRKYSKYDNGAVVGHSLFEETELQYYVPKGLMYPLLGAFRALVQIDSEGNYYWKKNPKDVWNVIGAKLVGMLLDEKVENPDALAKNTNLWSNLFKEVYIYAYI